jgi:hypothetical protein
LVREFLGVRNCPVTPSNTNQIFGTDFLPLVGWIVTLNNKIQQYAKELKGVRACQGCNQKATSLNTCSRCGLFWYCNKVWKLFFCHRWVWGSSTLAVMTSLVKLLARMRRVTKQIASYSRIQICRGCLWNRTFLRITIDLIWIYGKKRIAGRTLG